MKYDSLRRTQSKILRINKLSGGLNTEFSPNGIKDNQLSDCKNVLFDNGCLKTRKGLSCNPLKSLETEISGYSGENNYEIHNAGIYLNSEYKRIATAQVLTDDYAYYCNVFLIGETGYYTPIGRLSFFRVTSEVFYIPINFLFYTGKKQTGGGIFVMVTLQNDYDASDRYYRIYEINENFTEWNRIDNFYIPTLYINGRGNKYEIARSNHQVGTATPKILESPNMLNGRFHAYFTSDGHSNSFRLPFTNLASESIICRIYYNLVDYVQWQINANTMMDSQMFFGQEVTMETDREKGTVYFTTSAGDYAIPVMNMYHENNIKVTATKEIEGGICKVVHSTCVLSHNSRIIISGGESGNEIFVANYESPLYFPQNSSVKVGNGDSQIVDLSLQDGKIIALKQDMICALNLKTGEQINQISLLADNDKIFCKSDTFDCKEITKKVGCESKSCTVSLNDSTIFLGDDGEIYAITSLNDDGIICISDELRGSFKKPDFAFGVNDKYIIFKNNKALVGIFGNDKNISWYYWEFPDAFKISGGFSCKNTPLLLCSGQNTVLSYIAVLDDEKDSYLEYDDEGVIIKREAFIESKISTKHFGLSHPRSKFESIYLSLASKGNISILINGKQIADVNLSLTDNQYQNNEYKSVKLMPYINDNLLYITLYSKKDISIGDLEINYI